MAAMAAMAAVLKSRLSETSVNVMRQPVDIDGALRRGLEGSRPVTRDGPTLDRGTSTLDGQNPWMSLDVTGCPMSPMLFFVFFGTGTFTEFQICYHPALARITRQDVRPLTHVRTSIHSDSVYCLIIASLLPHMISYDFILMYYVSYHVA